MARFGRGAGAWRTPTVSVPSPSFLCCRPSAPFQPFFCHHPPPLGTLLPRTPGSSPTPPSTSRFRPSGTIVAPSKCRESPTGGGEGERRVITQKNTLASCVLAHVLFLSLPPLSFRTLYNLFTKAKYPDRVHAGVVQQNSQGDVGKRKGEEGGVEVVLVRALSITASTYPNSPTFMFFPRLLVRILPDDEERAWPGASRRPAAHQESPRTYRERRAGRGGESGQGVLVHARAQ